MCNIIFSWKIWVSYNGFVKKIILHIFIKGSMAPKNLEIALAFIICLFFASHLSNGLSTLLFNSSLIFLTMSPWSTSTCFFNVVIPLFLKYETRLFFQFVLVLHDILVYYNTTYNIDLWHLNINW
jgi:hypothetical protein